MSYAKYHEDDEKINEHRRHMQDGSELPQSKMSPIRYYDCKYCQAIFTEREALYLHIKSKHNVVRPLLFINGKIASNHCFIYHLDSAYINLFGYNGEIHINKSPLSKDNGDEINITQELDNVLSKYGSCRINFDTSSVDIAKIEYSVQECKQISNAIEQWEHDIASNNRVTDINFERLNEGMSFFLKGMFNYYVACRATKDKAKRYDDAWSYLTRFTDLPEVGRYALKVIAYRRNWVAWLKMLSINENDAFSAVVDFYDRKPFSKINNLETKQLYIEETTMQSMDLILLFQQGCYDEARKNLLSIPNIDDIDDPNLSDRINLVSARLAALDGDSEKAHKYYDKIITPVFKEEYELFKS